MNTLLCGPTKLLVFIVKKNNQECWLVWPRYFVGKFKLIPGIHRLRGDWLLPSRQPVDWAKYEMANAGKGQPLSNAALTWSMALNVFYLFWKQNHSELFDRKQSTKKTSKYHRNSDATNDSSTTCSRTNSISTLSDFSVGQSSESNAV